MADGHTEHVRSLVAVGGTEVYMPAVHVVCRVQTGLKVREGSHVPRR